MQLADHVALITEGGQDNPYAMPSLCPGIPEWAWQGKP
jgi:hypothetical protein